MRVYITSFKYLRQKAELRKMHEFKMKEGIFSNFYFLLDHFRDLSIHVKNSNANDFCLGGVYFPNNRDQKSPGQNTNKLF